MNRAVASRRWRLALIDRGAQFVIAARFLHVLPLRGDRRGMAIARIGFFSRGGPIVNAAIAYVVTCAGFIAILDGVVVNVVDFGFVHVVHGPVVEKVSAVPAAAFIAVAEIA